MSELPIGTREQREVEPRFDEAEEEQELTNALLEGGQSIAQAQKNARHAVRNLLSMAENNGEPMWTGLNGLHARGIAGRGQLAHQIIERDRLAAFGLDPMAVARTQLRARGWTDDEIDDVARNRLHRHEDGQVSFDGRIAGERGWTGDSLIALAVGQFHDALTKNQRAEPDPKTDAAHKKHAAGHGLNYRL